MARTLAMIKGPVLRWARTTAGFDIHAVAEQLGVDEDRYSAWELGEGAPTIPQLRKLAVLFRRPLAAFYLPEPPVGFAVMRDLRRLPGVGFRTLPPAVQFEIRAAMQRRALTIELAEDLGEDIKPFQTSATLEDDTEGVGARLRELLGVTDVVQQRWSDADGRSAYVAWRTRIEALGVLVFQTTTFESEDASGFAIWNDKLPVVAVNRRDSLTRRTFSMLHELAHLTLRVSGVSDAETDAARPPEDQAVEVFCNAVAASALMPAAGVLALELVRERPAFATDWTDAGLAEMARGFGVSREAFVRRLLSLGRTTDDFYRRKRAQYSAERERRRLEQREENRLRDEGIPRNMPRETIGNLGRPFIRMVLSNYHQDRLTLSEVSGYLGLKTKHIPTLEHDVGSV